MNPFLLVLIGMILVLIEFFLPGAILGVLGGILILAGVFIFASESLSPWEIVLFVSAIAIILGLLIRFAVWWIARSKPQYSIYSDDSQEGYYASSYDVNAIGKIGTVIADLKPGGYILIDGKQHPAISISGYIAKGKEVIVIGGQEQSLMVKSTKEV